MNKTKEQLAEEHWHLQYAMAKSEEIKPYVIEDYIAGYEASEPKWISVDESMPEYYDSVLAMNADGFFGVVWRANDDKTYDVYTISTTNCMLTEITHWMPLPSPPKQ